MECHCAPFYFGGEDAAADHFSVIRSDAAIARHVASAFFSLSLLIY